MQHPIYDVAIIGGGPAGSTAANLLSKKGRRVVVLERAKFPRFHVGESLLPYSLGALDRLGVRDQLDESAFPKHGGEIATSCGQRAVKFYFKDGFRLEYRRAYQVERAPFDKMLLDRARECGAEVREETAVNQVRFEADAVTLNIRTEGKDPEQIRSRYIIDCSGRHSVVGKHLGLKVSYEHLQKFSCYSHFTGVQRDPGLDAGLTRLVRGEDNWFWLIPLDEDRTSIGVVMDLAEFKARKLSPEQMLESAIENSPVMRERMKDAERVTTVHSVSDYSYRNSKLADGRWMLAGDAAGFIDPIFSTGVFLAIHSGEKCADALDIILDSPSRAPRLFARYDRQIHKVMDMYLRFVSAWYRPEFIDVFTTPTQRFELAPAINAVLAGNLGNSFAIWWRMQLFYLVLFLQRYFALCPRLSTSQSSAPEPVEQAA